MRQKINHVNQLKNVDDLITLKFIQFLEISLKTILFIVDIL